MSSVPKDLDRRMRDAAAQRVELRRVDAALGEVTAELLRMQQLADRWGREVGTLAEQLRDLGGFWRSLFGSRRESRARLDRELRDAKDAHDEADARIPKLESLGDELRAKRVELADAAGAYDAVLAEKEAWLRANAAQLVEPLDESAERIAASVGEVEALDAFVLLGRQAEGELVVAKQALQQARTANGAHIAGGHVMAAGASHRSFDEASRHLDRAADHLQKMSDELRGQGAVIQGIELRTGARLADVLLDSLSADLFVRRQILTAYDDVTGTTDRVRQAVWAAEKQRKISAEQLDVARAERERIIEEAS